jgi:hypothetical protein
MIVLSLILNLPILQKVMKFTKQEYADLHLLYGKTCFPEGVLPSRFTFVELHLHLCEVLTDSNTMASPILHLTPLDFNFWGHTKDLVYEVEINTKVQLQKRVRDAANQIRKNPEMLNSVYENWYWRTQIPTESTQNIYYKIIFLV